MAGDRFDVAVLGLGVMGSAAAWQLARRGLRVLGVEQFSPAHDRGSSHGLTRVIRQAYFEHPDYVPLVLRAYELWAGLEKDCGRELLRKTGGLMIGTEESAVFRGSLESARTHGLRHRVLSGADLARRFPQMKFRAGEAAVEEFDAGVLMAEDSVLAMQAAAEKAGAELRFGWPARPSELPAERVVVTAGAWLPALVPGLPLQVERQVLYWFRPVDASPLPLFIWERDGRPLYSIPDIRDHGIKVAFHHGGETTTPEALRREVGADELDELRRRLAESVPTLNGALVKSAVCMYTNTPDEHFAVGPLAADPRVLIVSPCSGHGFKFAPAIGEGIADLVSGSADRLPPLFRLSRFSV